MDAATIPTTFDDLRVVPVVEIADAASAIPLAEALAAGGLPVMEVTLRTPSALDAIRAISEELPEFTVGAGTVLTARDVDRAVAAGAGFVVSPGRTPALTAAAADAGVMFVPGAVTASEMLAAVDAGHDRIKFFPAESSGGAAALASLVAPLRASGARFMPTGGIRPGNLADYLAIRGVFAVGGTWIAPRDLLADRRFDLVTDRAASARLSAGGAR